MQRDQGIIITMVIFILLSLILAVLTYVGFNQSNKNFQDFTAAQAEASKNANDLRNKAQEADQLKQIIGYLPSIDTKTIADEHKASAEVLGANIPGANEAKGYRNILLQSDATLKGKIKELADAIGVNQNLQTQYDDLVARSTAVNNQYLNKMNVAVSDREEYQTSFEKTVSDIRAEGQKTLEELTTVKTDAEAAINQTKEEMGVIEAQRDKISKANEVMIDQLKELKAPTFDREDGKVVTVNQTSGVVIVNIGEASGIRPGITFSVYDPINKKLPIANSKASIEIVQVIGANTAEARILETMLTDPIQRGDLIYTPIWKPGSPPRFALCGKLTVGGIGLKEIDGTAYEDDLQDIINLVAANGGIVDCYMTLDGTIVGEITADTQFLVKGTGEGLDDAAMKSMYKLEQDAQLNGVREITLQDFLRRMGWKNFVPVRGFGSLATKYDLGPQPELQPFAVSRGTVAPLYDDRGLLPKAARGTVSPLYDKKDDVRPISRGTVAPLYNKDRIPVKSAFGTNVSGYYGGGKEGLKNKPEP